MSLVALLPLLLTSSLVPEREQNLPKSAHYGIDEVREWGDQMAKLAKISPVEIAFSSKPVFLSVSAQPAKILLNATYFPDHLTREEAKAALAREIANLTVASEADSKDLIRWPSELKAPKPIDQYGLLSLKGRIKALDEAENIMVASGVSRVAMLTLHEIEAREIAIARPMIDGMIGGAWSDIRKVVLQRALEKEKPPRRSLVSYQYRVNPVVVNAETEFWFRDIKLFQLPLTGEAERDKLTNDLNLFFDSSPQISRITVQGKELSIGKMKIRMASEQHARSAQQRTIMGAILWQQMTLLMAG